MTHPWKKREYHLLQFDYLIQIVDLLGGAKVSCIFCHWGVQLILAYSWARPAILVAGKGRELMFLFLLFLHFHSCSSFFPVPLFHLFCYLFCLFSLSLGDDTKWPTRVDVSLNPNSINQWFKFTLNGKQCRSRSVGFFRSHLIWINTVCKGRV